MWFHDRSHWFVGEILEPWVRNCQWQLRSSLFSKNCVFRKAKSTPRITAQPWLGFALAADILLQIRRVYRTKSSNELPLIIGQGIIAAVFTAYLFLAIAYFCRRCGE